MQFSLYQEDSDLANASIWALAAKVLSTLLPPATSSTVKSFPLDTVTLRIAGREQPTNWLPELYDHRDLDRGLNLTAASRRAQVLEDVLLRLLETRDLVGDEVDADGAGGAGLVVRVLPHEHMPAFDRRIHALVRRVFPTLDSMDVLCFS